MSAFAKVALSCALLLAACPLTAANLVSNGDFDDNAAGWDASWEGAGAGAGWVDDVGYPTPGAALLYANMPGATASMTQCIAIDAMAVDAFAYSRIEYTGGLPNYGELTISAFGSPNCTDYLGYRYATLRPAGGGWVEHRIENHALPPGTVSVLVFLDLDQEGSSTGIHFDRVAFGPTGTIGLEPTPPNVLVNPTFDTSALGWSLVEQNDASAYWISSEGWPSGGAVYLSAGFPEQVASARQCVDIDEQAVDLGAYARAMSWGGQPDFGSVSLSMFSEPVCHGSYLGEAHARPQRIGDGWVLHRFDGVMLPAGTKSARVGLTMAFGGASASVAMDNAYFGATGATGLPPPAANRMSNGDFATDLLGWERVPPHQVFHTGAQGHPTPGALRIESPPGTPHARQCLNLDSAISSWDFVGHAKSDGGVGGTRFALSFHDQFDCAGGPVDEVEAAPLAAGTGWVPFALTGHVPAAQARSVQIRVGARVGASAVIHIDDVAFGATGTIAIPTGHRIGGVATGIVDGSLVLELNGSETRAVTADGAFAFETRLLPGATYSVAVKTPPTGSSCVVMNGDGLMPDGDVDDVVVTCGVADDRIFANGFE